MERWLHEFPVRRARNFESAMAKIRRNPFVWPFSALPCGRREKYAMIIHKACGESSTLAKIQSRRARFERSGMPGTCLGHAPCDRTTDPPSRSDTPRRRKGFTDHRQLHAAILESSTARPGTRNRHQPTPLPESIRTRRNTPARSSTRHPLRCAETRTATHRRMRPRPLLPPSGI
jgi:hypothetical protein